MQRRHQPKTPRQRKIRYTILLMTLVCVSVYSLWTGSNSYPASEEAREAMESNETVTVLEKNNVISFQSEESGIGYIIYPDAAIDPKSYAPLAQDLITTLGGNAFIVQYPFRKNYLNISACSSIQKDNPEITNWYVIAHGSGGTWSNLYLNNQVDAMIYLSGYPLMTLSSEIPIMTMRGSLDAVHGESMWRKKMKLFPKQTVHYEIQTGNYSYFASFGLRNDDNVGLLSPSQQRQKVIENIQDFMNEL